MLLRKKFVVLASLAAAVLLPSCSNSPWASELERSLAADPNLENGSLFGTPSASPSPMPADDVDQSQLLSQFPAEIPRYPNAQLVVSTPLSDRAASSVTIGQSEVIQTQWTTADPAIQVQQFYQQQFQTANWQIINQSGNQSGNQSSSNPASATSTSATPTPASPIPASPTAGTANSIVAERDGLRVTVTIPPTTITPTAFSIDYQFVNSAVAESPASSPNPDDAQANVVPQPGDPDFIGPVPPANWGVATNTNPAASATSVTQIYADLNQAPAELQPYIVDLAQLGALPLQANAEAAKANPGTATELKPNQAITRREYARWLVTANNLIYANQPARKIRLAVASDQPSFSDVPTTDPDFGVIQGLANAGLIPSALSGDATAVTFRPDAPLSREAMTLWKVPVDLRQALPNATIEAVQQAWGFQDAARIDPVALKAVLADYQNGDLSNIRRAFGYTTLFQPKKSVTRAEAAAALWFFGLQAEGLSAKDALQANQSQVNPVQPLSQGNQPQSETLPQ